MLFFEKELLMKTSLLKPFALSIGAAIILVSVLCGGTTLLSLDLKTLTLRAHHIVVGRVMDSTSFMKEKRVLTFHRVEITKSIVSDKKEGDVIEVVTEGGQTATFTQKVEGAAELADGKEYLLFLDIRGNWGAAYVTGMSQGAYPISTDDSSTVKFVQPPNRLPRLVARDTATLRLQDKGFWLKEKTRLDSMIEEILTIEVINETRDKKFHRNMVGFCHDTFSIVRLWIRAPVCEKRRCGEMERELL
jgi:hypothetical protein